MFKDKTLERKIKETYKGDNLLNILHLIQDTEGFLSKELLLHISKLLNIPLAKLHSTASFYSFFVINKNSANHIQICKCIACELKGINEISQTIEKTIGLSPGQSNEKFIFEKTECVGRCDQSPVMMFNGNAVENLTHEKVVEILSKC